MNKVLHQPQKMTTAVSTGRLWPLIEFVSAWLRTSTPATATELAKKAAQQGGTFPFFFSPDGS